MLTRATTSWQDSWHGSARTKLSPSAPRADLPQAPRRRETGETTRHGRGKVRDRELAPPTAQGDAARGHRGVRRKDGRYARGPRSRARGRVARALGTSKEASEAKTLRRGDVFWADLSPRSGSEQGGRRPVVIVSHDGFNLTPAWRSVIVVPVTTSKAQEERGPSAVPLPSGAGGLKRSSFALCHQITTLDCEKLANRLGALPPHLLRTVERGLKAALDLD